MSACIISEETKPASGPLPNPASRRERDYLSYSAIRTYRDCPLRYYFRYVAGLPEETVSASLVFGSAIHRALEHHFGQLMAGQPAPAIEALLDKYRKGWDESATRVVRFAADENRAPLDQLAERMLLAFRQHDLSRPAGRILAVEEPLRGPVIPGLPDILGRVDLIVETPDALVISDFKTARSRWTAEQVEHGSEQLLLYSELVQNVARNKPLRIEIAVLSKTKTVQLERHAQPVIPARVARTKRAIERVWRAIDAGHFYPAPSQINCTGCPYRRPCQEWRG